MKNWTDKYNIPTKETPLEEFQKGGTKKPVHGNISQYKEQDYLERIGDIVSNPLTSFGYVARNESLPKYLDRGLKSGQIKRNILDNPLDLVNPSYYANSAGRGLVDIVQGKVEDFAGEVLNFIPAMKTVGGVGRIAKNSNKLKTFINSIGGLDATLHTTTGKDLIGSKAPKKQQGGTITPSGISQFKKKPFQLKDERGEVVRENIPNLQPKNNLLINETENAAKDKAEFQRTGQIKNPRSVHYQRLAPKQSNLTTQTKSDAELNEQLGLERPLVYLASPDKLIGDVAFGINPDNKLGFETSELDRQAIIANRANPYQSRTDRFINNAKIGAGYVPEAAVNTAMAAAFMPEGSGALGLLNEAVNPLAGMANPLKNIKTSVAPDMGEALIRNMDNTGANITRNTNDLKQAQEFANKYGYELPQNIERIAQSDELTNRTVRGMMNRHNTFVRGVSTNWAEIGARNPEILRHLEGKGIDWKNNPKAAAEYMSTHVPIQTGYGRASLNQDVFKRGEDAIYTSNSIPTAEGYTYGQGYITKVKKPTDFSSIERKDWITKNDPKYSEDYLPDNFHSPQTIEHHKNVLKNIEENKPFDFGHMTIKKEGDKQFWRSKFDSNKEYWDDLSKENYDNALTTAKKEADKTLEDASKQKLLKTDALKPDVNPFFRQNEVIEKFIADNNLGRNTDFVQKFGDSYLTKENLMLEGEINHLAEQLYKTSGTNAEAIRDKLRLLEKQKQDMYIKNTDDFLENYSKDYKNYKNNKYAHYLHLGTPGEKILEPIKSWEITPEIWKNKSRAHTNIYSKKLSALEQGGTITPWYNKYQ